jgi:hypothetical protein
MSIKLAADVKYGFTFIANEAGRQILRNWPKMVGKQGSESSFIITS